MKTLIAERAASGLTNAQLAAAVGVSEESMTRYVRGRREVPTPVLIRTVDALGLTMVEFWRRVEERAAAASD
ncbi:MULTISPECIES: helix-turn-helix domain-containing protein [unclassified Isoptericola]|uniref:helix-turn-helix domain-containing protein n=1 Tax=Isoptericola sp. NPDC057191 TaxID=3346041 RepID=UPI0036400D7E